MFFKSTGTYLVMGTKYAVIVRVIGQMPHLQIAEGISLSKFVNGGEVVLLDRNSLELQAIESHPDKFSYIALEDYEMDSLEELDVTTTTKPKPCVGFSELAITKWKPKLKDILTTKGLHMNSLYCDIMAEGYSLPQARMIASELKKELTRNA